jgi:hypothetical protein
VPKWMLPLDEMLTDVYVFPKNVKEKGRLTFLVWSSPVMLAFVVPAIQARDSLSVRQ